MKNFLFKLLLSLLFIIYIIFNIDWQIIWASILKINIVYYLLATFIAIISPIFLALKYHMLIKNTSLSVPICRLLTINFISVFYSLFIPSLIGPDAVRWYKVTKNKQGRSFFLASTTLERIFFLLTLLSFATLPLFFYTDNSQIINLRFRLVPLLAVAFFLLSCGLIFFIFPNIQKKLKNFIINFLPKQKNSKLSQFFMNYEIKQPIASTIGALCFLSFAWQIFFLFRMVLLFLSLHISLSIIDISWMCSLVLLLQVLPISFAGIGVREGAYAYLFPLFGLPPEKGIIIGILFFTQMFTLASIGAILNLLES
jgi:uncharacterized protein (TIRG00374 family)